MLHYAAVPSSSSSVRVGDIFTSHAIQKHMFMDMNQVLHLAATESNMFLLKKNTLASGWKDHVFTHECTRSGVSSVEKRRIPIAKAVAIAEPELHVMSLSLREESLSGESSSKESSSEEPDSPEIDYKEKMRRMKISKALKGSTPWNKGRKHKPETLARIREATRLAMQDPKVRMRLVQHGRTQSLETREKIRKALKACHQKKREKIMMQEHCFSEWKVMVADFARKGFSSETELQWDSYELLDEQLKQERLESGTKKKAMPRPKPSRRAPKSAEQRKRISEAISAKWSDPVYRENVHRGIAQYHGSNTQRRERVNQEDTSSGNGIDSTIGSRIKKNMPPSYKDPMASAKLKMIKNIRDKRVNLEQQIREAMERATLLIAEAEKAANELEMFIESHPVKASLLETRILISEAKQWLASLKNGQLPPQVTSDATASADDKLKLHDYWVPKQDGEISTGNLLVNGIHPKVDNDHERCFSFKVSPLQTAVAGEQWANGSGNADASAWEFRQYASSSTLAERATGVGNTTDLHTVAPLVNGSMKPKITASRNCEVGPQMKDTEPNSTGAKIKKKWVCGRLVVVESD